MATESDVEFQPQSMFDVKRLELVEYLRHRATEATSEMQRHREMDNRPGFQYHHGLYTAYSQLADQVEAGRFI